MFMILCWEISILSALREPRHRPNENSALTVVKMQYEGEKD